ncbi:outer membrane protein assembly factor BamE [Glaciecola sp. 2405UD65-10]|jgi:outer membrane protein assembly factor BamE|uniref:outer membrane protein assembly factor BamE n=1 Tax=Glaciecola sp. 2405UD65-10 TaxID=3397244 RepID=UPI003B5985A2
MKSIHLAVIFSVCIFTTACSDWIYRIDVPQGNFLEQKDVDKLRVQMSKEQVRFVLGNAVVEDSFDTNTWYYVYDMKRGMKKRGEDVRKELVLRFKDDKLSALEGDFERPEEFDTPLDS